VISKWNRIYAATRAISVGSRRWRTIPGAVFLLPDEAPRQIAEVTAAALERASRSSGRDHRGRAETARSRRESGPWIAGLDLLGP
jgi:hypothetical protein